MVSVFHRPSPFGDFKINRSAQLIEEPQRKLLRRSHLGQFLTRTSSAPVCGTASPRRRAVNGRSPTFSRPYGRLTRASSSERERSTGIGCNNEVGGIVFMVRVSLRPTGSNDLLTQLRRDSFQRRSADTSGGAPDAILARGDAQSSHGLLKSEALRASETNRVRLSKHGPDAVRRKDR